MALYIPHRLPQAFVNLGITERCNLNCRMCGKKSLGIGDDDMPLDLILRILDRIPQRNYQIDFTGWGEPLMHPGLFEAVGHAKKRGFTTSITTNGLLLHQETREKVLESALDMITFSVDSISDYRKASWLGHPHHRELLETISQLSQARGTGPLYIVLLCILIRPEPEGYLELIRVARELGVDLVMLERLVKMHDPDLKGPTLSEEKRIVSASLQLGIEIGQSVMSLFSHPRGVRRTFYRFGRYCPNSYRGVYIDRSGNVTPCCNLPRLIMGNILVEGLEEIWNRPAFKDFRKNHPSQNCARCDYVKPYHLI